MSPEQYFRNGWTEYLIHIPEGTEHPIEILVLRGHILIERQMARLIEMVLPNPTALELEHMRFSAKVKLAQALVGQEALPWLWESLKIANKLRNSLAHKRARGQVVQRALGPALDVTRTSNARYTT